jgi:hypothetical protein
LRGDKSGKLYPNPVKQAFSIRFRVSEPSLIILDIYDLGGNKIDQMDWGKMKTGIHTRNVDAGDLPEGIYLFTLRIGNQGYSGKFIKTDL